MKTSPLSETMKRRILYVLWILLTFGGGFLLGFFFADNLALLILLAIPLVLACVGLRIALLKRPQVHHGRF